MDDQTMALLHKDRGKLRGLLSEKKKKKKIRTLKFGKFSPYSYSFFKAMKVCLGGNSRWLETISKEISVSVSHGVRQPSHPALSGLGGQGKRLGQNQDSLQGF